MPGKTMSDWEKSLRQEGFNDYASRLHTVKEEDVARLKKSGLPQFDWFELPYQDFSQENKKLADWIEKYISLGQGFCIRAIPTVEGIKKEYTRKPTLGYLTFKDCAEFLEKVALGERNLWNVIMTNWEPSDFRGVIISGEKYVTGEIARNLEKLTSMEETPSAGFIFDRGRIGYITDKTRWVIEEDKDAKKILWETFFKFIKQGSDSFNPFLLKGYFEFVHTKTNQIMFLDYKENEYYLK